MTSAVAAVATSAATAAAPVAEPASAAWQGRFNVLATELADAYPKDFAVAEINGDGASGWIGFRAAAPAKASAQVAALGATRVVANLGYTALQLEDTSSLLARTAEGALTPESGVTVFREGTENTFQVVIAPGFALESRTDGVPEIAEGDPEELALVADEVEDRVAELGLPSGFTVAVSVGAEAALAPEAFDGGGRIAGLCTTAFPIKRNGGPELGLLTAGHCPGTGSYNNTANAFHPVFPMSLATTDVHPGGEFRWAHSRTMLSGKTNVGAGGTKKFTSAANPSVGSNVCNFGLATGHKCAKLTRTGIYVSIPIPDANNRVYRVGPLRGVTNHITAGGDSGGPWFSGTTAYGIHMGNAAGSAFSSVPNALSRLGVSLWTG